MIIRITIKRKNEYNAHKKICTRVIKTLWILFIPIYSWDVAWEFF